MDDQRKGKANDLPFDLVGLDEKALAALLRQVIKAQQQNNDSLQSDIKGIVRTFNKLAGDVKFIGDYLGVSAGGPTGDKATSVTGGESYPSHDELEDVSADDHHSEAHTVLSTAHSDTDETDTPATGDSLVWDGTQWIADYIDEGGTGRRRKQTKPYALFQEAHSHEVPFAIPPTPLGSATPGTTAAAGVAGTDSEASREDHVHPHGTGYAGGHSDAVNDGDAAGGDLSGTYPNPSVTDDSHAHTASTLPVTPVVPVSFASDDGDAFGMWVPPTPGSGTADGTIALEDDTVSVGDFDTIDFGTGLDVTDDGGGHATVDASGAVGSDGRDGVPGFAGADGDDFGMWVPPSATAASGDPTMGGDIDGTASDARLYGLTKSIFPTIAADQDDWAPTGLSGANVISVENTDVVGHAITGIDATGVTEGRLLLIFNYSSGVHVELNIDDTGSAAANRITWDGGSIVRLTDGQSVLLRYDAGISRWVIMGPANINGSGDAFGFGNFDLNGLRYLQWGAGITDVDAQSQNGQLNLGLDIDIKDDGIGLGAAQPIFGLDFGTGLAVTDNTDGTITIDGSGAGGAGPPGIAFDGEDGFWFPPTDNNKDPVVAIEIFTSDGTWTKPNGASVVHVLAIGAGGGGGSGRRAATANDKFGGGGGGGGGIVRATIPASVLGTSETVVVGVGGAGGAGKSANGVGNPGTDGEDTTFGSIVTAQGGPGGAGGDGSSGAGGVSPVGNTFLGWRGGDGSDSSITGASPDALDIPTTTGRYGAGGGGAGGGVNAADTERAGGDGADAYALAGGVHGAAGGGAVGAGGDSGATWPVPGAGGGGAGGNTAGASDSGGAGGDYGGGGGGGGAVLGVTGGDGGLGANGVVMVVTVKSTVGAPGPQGAAGEATFLSHVKWGND